MPPVEAEALWGATLSAGGLKRRSIMKMGKFQSGQMGQTVNLLTFVFGGSNPSLPTSNKIAEIAQSIEH